MINYLGLDQGEELEIGNGIIQREQDKMYLILSGESDGDLLLSEKLEEIAKAHELIGTEIGGCRIDQITIHHMNVYLHFNSDEEGAEEISIKLSNYVDFLDKYKTKRDSRFRRYRCPRSTEHKK